MDEPTPLDTILGATIAQDFELNQLRAENAQAKRLLREAAGKLTDAREVNDRLEDENNKLHARALSRLGRLHWYEGMLKDRNNVLVVIMGHWTFHLLPRVVKSKLREWDAHQLLAPIVGEAPRADQT